MPNLKTIIPFSATPEQMAALDAVIAKHKGAPGATMPVLQEAQEIFGYLPEEVQVIIAEGLGLSLSDVYGVVSFYAQFSLNPKGKKQIAVCMGTACYVKGAGEILARIEDKVCCKAGGVTEDGMFSIDACRCIGACGLAPVIIVDGNYHGNLKLDEVDGIIEKYMVEGDS
jgi:NADH-quinone oxidoreductase subunit E/NADP-reducing hydrogenase subunit HndA